MSYDAWFKIIIFGDESPGKTMFIQKYLTNLFVSDRRMTVGVDFEVKSVTVDGVRVKLDVWDLGGEERFRLLLPTYVKGARGALFLYDVTEYLSIAHIDDWLSIIRKEIRAEERFPIFVVGIVPDEECERHITREEGIKIVKSRNLDGFIECNPKTGENVEKTFEALTSLMLYASRHQKGKKEKVEEEANIIRQGLEALTRLRPANNEKGRKRGKKGKKEEYSTKDIEDIITYTRHLGKRLRNLETENQLLDAERFRLEKLVFSF